MNSLAVDYVQFRVKCRTCGVQAQVDATEIARAGPVTILRATDRNYCACGGQKRTEYQVAITADPEGHPVMEIVPARPKVTT